MQSIRHLPNLPRDFAPTFQNTEAMSIDQRKILEIAYLIFSIRNSFRKIYFNNKGDAYAKTKALKKSPKYPHSIRKISHTVFMLTIDRKSEKSLLGDGAYKVAKSSWKIELHPQNKVTVKSKALVKDRASTKSKPPSDPFSVLKGIPNVEYALKQTHRTSKNTYIQFHFKRKSPTTAYNIKPLSSFLNFSHIASICKDIARGVFDLLNRQLIQADMKPINILIYYPKKSCPRFHAKISDIDSVYALNSNSGMITFIYLAGNHYHSLIEAKATEQGTSIRSVVVQEKDPYPHQFTLTEATALTTLGLTLAEIGLNALTSRCKGLPAQMEEFWKIITELVGFAPDESMTTYRDFRKAYEDRIKTLPRTLWDFPHAITFPQLIERLDALSKPVPLISIEQSPYLPIMLEIKTSHNPRHDAELLKSNINRIYSLARAAVVARQAKFYFNDVDAYAKQVNRTGIDFPHSVRILNLDPLTFIVEFNRKEPFNKTSWDQIARITKKVWKVTLTALIQLTADPLYINKTGRLKKKESKKLPIEDLPILDHANYVQTMSHKKSNSFYRAFQINESLQLLPQTFWDFCSSGIMSFQNFLKIFQNIILGVNELHTHGLLYGNIMFPYILLSPASSTSTTPTAKLGILKKPLPIGTNSGKISIYSLSPTHLLIIYTRVKKTEPNASRDYVINEYKTIAALRTLPITREDEVAATALFLSYLIIILPQTIKNQNKQKIEKLKKIVVNLTGGLNVMNCKNWNQYVIKLTDYIYWKYLFRRPIPHPRISLEEAARRIIALS